MLPESLAARVEIVDLHGFDVLETQSTDFQKLWLRGGFPLSYLTESDENSSACMEGFVGTFLERDIPLLGINIASTTLRRFWTMLAHSHGQILNSSSHLTIPAPEDAVSPAASRKSGSAPETLPEFAFSAPFYPPQSDCAMLRIQLIGSGNLDPRVYHHLYRWREQGPLHGQGYIVLKSVNFHNVTR
jgi:hypothetical protein